MNTPAGAKEMRIAYPVIFTDTVSNILIEVPDLGILTEANAEGEPKGTTADAIMMARDAIGISCITNEDEGLSFIEPSDLSDINIGNGTFANDGPAFVSLVDVDLSEYRRRLDNKMVRRNVTLPNWLNKEAERLKINVSRVLQEALAEKVSQME